MIKQTALLLPALLVLMGCSGENDGGVHKAGQRVGETITEFAKGVGKGVDTQLKVPVELNEQVTNLGLRTTVAKDSSLDGGGSKTLAVYFIASRPVNTCLLAKALNAKGEEIGRSAVDLELAADDAKYVTFAFDSEMDMQLVDKYVVEVKKTMSKETMSKENATTVEDPAAGESDKES